MKHKTTDEQFAEAVKNSEYMADLLRKIGLRTFNYKSIRGRIERLGLDTSHWATPRNPAFAVGHAPLNRKHISEWLKPGMYNLKGTGVARRLVDAKLVEEICNKCGLGNIWNDERLNLHLDHINGINTDYRLENLRLLCPNCHSQTDTFCGRNLKGAKISRKCEACSLVIHQHNKSGLCKKCLSLMHKDKVFTKRFNHKIIKHKTKIQWPSIEDILLALQTKAMSVVGKELGLSDNAVKKHLKYNGVNIADIHGTRNGPKRIGSR